MKENENLLNKYDNSCQKVLTVYENVRLHTKWTSFKILSLLILFYKNYKQNKEFFCRKKFDILYLHHLHHN